MFKASFDPLLRVFCRKLVFRGATLHCEKQDAERRQNEIKEGKEGGERRRKNRRFQWKSEFLGCSAAELMTGAYVRDTQLQSHNQPAEERRNRKKVLSWEGDAGWGGRRRHLEILLPSLLFLVLSRPAEAAVAPTAVHIIALSSGRTKSPLMSVTEKREVCTKRELENLQPSDSSRHR